CRCAWERTDCTSPCNACLHSPACLERGRADCVARAPVCILAIACAPGGGSRACTQGSSREVAMKRWLVGLLVLLSPSAFAQQSPPEIPYDSAANPLHLPPHIHLGEVAGVA